MKSDHINWAITLTNDYIKLIWGHILMSKNFSRHETWPLGLMSNPKQAINVDIWVPLCRQYYPNKKVKDVIAAPIPPYVDINAPC